MVSAASRHGATAEIAEELGEALGDALPEPGGSRDEIVDVRPAKEVASVEDYDAVVFGSAVYMGHWLDPARELTERHADTLAGRSTWLFSSGPIGDPPKPEEPGGVTEILEATGARGHRVFSGRIDGRELGFGEKAVMMVFRAREGDFRNWEAVRGSASRRVANVSTSDEAAVQSDRASPSAKSYQPTGGSSKAVG